MKNMLRVARKFVTLREFSVLALSLVLLVVLSQASMPNQMPGSVEVKFTDASAHGLSIVPASCPSSPHYTGDCTNFFNPSYAEASYYSQSSYVQRCTPSATCIDSHTIRYVTTSCAQNDVACPGYWSCSSGACIPPPPPSFQSFTGTTDTGATFTSDGHLSAHPTLVRSGSASTLYWNITNVASCTVSSPNGDNFTCSGTTCSSGAKGQVTKPLPHETTYTLACTSLSGATPPSLSESVKVTVVPTYQEQ